MVGATIIHGLIYRRMLTIAKSFRLNGSVATFGGDLLQDQVHLLPVVPSSSCGD